MPIHELNLTHLANHYGLASVEYALDPVSQSYVVRCRRSEGGRESSFVFHVPTDGLRGHRLSILEYIQLHLEELHNPTGKSIDQRLREEEPTAVSLNEPLKAISFKDDLIQLFTTHALDIVSQVPKDILAEYTIRMLQNLCCITSHLPSSVQWKTGTPKCR